MASATVPPGSPPGNLQGVVDLEIDVFDIKPEYSLSAVEITILNPAGDGVRMWLDLGLALDVALRIGVAVTRLRGLAGP
jgi:hypothetical protein